MNKIILTSMPLMFALTACVKGQHIDSPTLDKNPTRYGTYQNQKFDLNAPQTLKTDRYTLVELDDPIYKYVLDQIIDISIPKNVNLSVKEGMDYVLNQSGYVLCDSEQTDVLYQSILPKVHYKMGPIKLGQSLQIMAGPAWKLVIDDIEREICFELADGYHKKITQADTKPPLNATLPVVKNEVVLIKIKQQKTESNVGGSKDNSEVERQSATNTTLEPLSQSDRLGQIKKLESKDDCKE